MTKIDIKPLSVNEAWQGKRFKTKKYLAYEKEVLLKLPAMRMPKAPYVVTLEFGFSNAASDIDNPTKLVLDLIQKKYKINDKHIYEMHLYKTLVPRGQEFISFEIKSLED